VRLSNAHFKSKQMTPKEKAKELVYKHFEFVEAWSGLNQIENAKQCALITVDELIKQEISLLGLSENYIPTWYNWVKEEIKKITA
jgi:hypothetical protein